MLLSSLRIVSFGIVGHTFDIIILLSGLNYLLILIGFSLIIIGVGLLTAQSTSSTDDRNMQNLSLDMRDINNMFSGLVISAIAYTYSCC